MKDNVTFDRPIAAKLIVRLENGDEFEPTPKDLYKFGLASRADAYFNFTKNLRKVIGEDSRLDEGDISMLRYFVERSVFHYGAEMLEDFTCSDDPETLEQMRAVLVKLSGWEGGTDG